MIKYVSSLLAKPGQAARMLVVCCLCLGLAACAETGPTADSDKPLGSPGARKSLAYGVSINVPNDWTVINSVEPGTLSDAELESRVRSGRGVPLLVMVRPTNVPQQADARVLVFVADSVRHVPPEQEILPLTQAQLDAQSVVYREQTNQAARSANKNVEVVDWRITKDQVNGKMALLQRGFIRDAEGDTRMMIFYIYLPGNMAVAVEAAGKDDVPGIETVLESIARSVTVSR